MTDTEAQSESGSDPAAEERSGPDHDLLEVVATVILGLAVLAIAFSSLQSSLWNGEQATATTSSVLASDQANDLFQLADGTKTLDQILFVEFLVSCNTDAADESDEGLGFACEQIFNNLSEPGQDALEVWLESDDVLPFETDAYLSELYLEAEDEREASEALFLEAREANTNGDRFETASTSLAMVLFFAGISLVIGWVRLRWVLLGISMLIFVVAIVYLLSLQRV